jgi:hypothetical protein
VLTIHPGRRLTGSASCAGGPRRPQRLPGEASPRREASSPNWETWGGSAICSAVRGRSLPLDHQPHTSDFAFTTPDGPSTWTAGVCTQGDARLGGSWCSAGMARGADPLDRAPEPEVGPQRD